MESVYREEGTEDGRERRMEEGWREGAHLRYADLLDDIVLPILFLPNKEGPAI